MPNPRPARSRATASMAAFVSGVHCVLELDRVPRVPGATIEDVGFGEDFELLAAVEDPGTFAVVGRVEEGEGVEVLLDGAPFPLAGWEHFS